MEKTLGTVHLLDQANVPGIKEMTVCGLKVNSKTKVTFYPYVITCRGCRRTKAFLDNPYFEKKGKK